MTQLKNNDKGSGDSESPLLRELRQAVSSSGLAEHIADLPGSYNRSLKTEVARSKNEQGKASQSKLSWANVDSLGESLAEVVLRVGGFDRVGIGVLREQEYVELFVGAGARFPFSSGVEIVGETLVKSTRVDNYSSEATNERGTSTVTSRVVLPFFVADNTIEQLRFSYLAAFGTPSTRSLALLPLTDGATVKGWVECHRFCTTGSFAPDERSVLLAAAQIIESTYGMTLRALPGVADYGLATSSGLSESIEGHFPDNVHSRRVASHSLVPLSQYQLGEVGLLASGPLFFLRVSNSYEILEVFGEVEEIIGVTPRALLGDPLHWGMLIDDESLRKLKKLGREQTPMLERISVEIGFKHAKTGLPGCLRLLADPVELHGELSGWIAVCFNVSERRRTELALVQERSRLQALVQVGKAIQSAVDPELVALLGLSSLIEASGCSGGYVVFRDGAESELELVAAKGLRASFVETFAAAPNEHRGICQVLTSGESVRWHSVTEGRQVGATLEMAEGIRSSVLMPLVHSHSPGSSSRPLGVMVLCSRRSACFSSSDLQLFEIAAQQISRRVAQTKYFSAQKRHGKAMELLYKQSSTLSKSSGSGEAALPLTALLARELGMKRVWLAELNQSRSTLQGVGGFGPGLDKETVSTEVPLGSIERWCNGILSRERSAADWWTILTRDGSEGTLAFGALFQRFCTGYLVVVALRSAGQVVGVLALEPLVPQQVFEHHGLRLVKELSSEIASVLLSKRYETYLAEAEKMRMASTFSGSIAHNFNNLLQAVMGNASLLVRHLEEGTPLHEVAVSIEKAAERGARLVGRMAKVVAATPKFEGEATPLLPILQSELRDWQSKQFRWHSIELALEGRGGAAESPKVYCEPVRLRQVLQNVLSNAAEAMQLGRFEPESAGEVTGEQRSTEEVSVLRVGLRTVLAASKELHPELCAGYYVLLTIADSGVGMTEDQLKRCMEPFFSSKNVDAATGIPHDGGGLGLSVCYALMREIGGVVLISSTYLKGTSVRLVLPAKDAP